MKWSGCIAGYTEYLFMNQISQKTGTVPNTVDENYFYFYPGYINSLSYLTTTKIQERVFLLSTTGRDKTWAWINSFTCFPLTVSSNQCILSHVWELILFKCCTGCILDVSVLARAEILASQLNITLDIVTLPSTVSFWHHRCCTIEKA